MAFLPGVKADGEVGADGPSRGRQLGVWAEGEEEEDGNEEKEGWIIPELRRAVGEKSGAILDGLISFFGRSVSRGLERILFETGWIKLGLIVSRSIDSYVLIGLSSAQELFRESSRSSLFTSASSSASSFLYSWISFCRPSS